MLEETEKESLEKEYMRKVLDYLFFYKNKIEKLKNKKYDICLNIGLCTNDNNIQHYLDNKFNENKLCYYDWLGNKVDKNSFQRKGIYRFKGYDERILFVDNLINELILLFS